MKATFAAADPHDVDILTNGCGPQVWYLRWVNKLIPKGLFEQAGRQHDWEYTVGGSWIDRRRADIRFLGNCLISAADAHWLLIAPMFVMAILFFLAVKLGGPTCFHYTTHPRTLDEMHALAQDTQTKDKEISHDHRS